MPIIRPPAVAAILAVLALAWILPTVTAHGERHRPGDELFGAGEKLMVGGFRGDQAGPLLVIPYVDGALPCSRDDAVPYRVPVSANVSVTLLHNATHVEAGFALDSEPVHYLAFGADTGEAVRALFVMQEHVVAIHRLESLVLKDANASLRSGHLGVPYAAGPSAHGVSHPLEGGGLSIAYDKQASAPHCEAAGPTRPALAIAKAGLRERAEPGRLLHVVLLYDPHFSDFLPRPIDGSTIIYQANVYLARPGEDPEAVRAAFDPAPAASDVASLGALLLALVGVAAAGWRVPRA